MQKRFLNLVVLSTSLAFSGAAMAQDSVQQAPQSAIVVPTPVNVGSANVLPPAVSTNDPRPPVPSPIVGKRLTLIHQAGIGGPTSYARGGVLEFGGSFAFMNGTRYTNLSATPSVGFFLTNNFELSALLNVAYNRNIDSVINANGSVDQKVVHSTSVVALIEPSVHLPMTDHLFVFGGLGLGVAYHQDSKTGFAMAPRVGFDIMVGRSGILSPAFNLNWSTNSARNTSGQVVTDSVDGRLVAVRTLIGASLGYRVMF